MFFRLTPKGGPEVAVPVSRRRLWPLVLGAVAVAILLLVWAWLRFAPNDVQVFAVDEATGRLLWSTPKEFVYVDIVSPVDDKVVVVGLVHTRRCVWKKMAITLDRRTGRRVAKNVVGEGGSAYRLTAWDEAAEFSANGFASHQSSITIEARDRRTNSVLWTADAGSGEAFQLKAGSGVVAISVGPEEASRIVVLDARTGHPLWDTTQFYSLPGRFAIGDGQLYTFGPPRGALTAFDARTGQVRWKKTGVAGAGFGDLAGVAAEDGMLVTGGSTVDGLTPTGARRWSFFKSYAPLGASEGIVYLASRGQQPDSCGGD
jgi:outer membrane protein assembly factor BamB